MTRRSRGRRFLQFGVCCIAAALTAACYVKPLPEDFAGVDSFQIAQRIRCEARDSARHQLKLALQAYASGRWLIPDDVEKSRRALHWSNIQPRIIWRRMLKKMEEGTFDYAKFFATDLKAADPHERSLISRYRYGIIAYQFKFDITEQNDIGGSSTLIDVLSGGMFSFGLTAKTERKRKNVRRFRIVDQADDLATGASFRRDECENLKAGHDLGYPITGELGLDETIGTFLRLNERVDLRAADGTAETPTMTDTITFTTAVEGSFNPNLALSRGPATIRISQIGLTSLARRSDVHELVVAVNLPSRDDVKELDDGGKPEEGGKPGKTSRKPKGRTKTPVDPAKERARNEKDLRKRLAESALRSLDAQLRQQFYADTEAIRQSVTGE